MRTQSIRRILPFALLITIFFIFQSFQVSVTDEIEIQVSPSTLNLQNQGQVVTVHTDIPYSSVVGASVTLSGIPIDWWKADNLGYFVAKFYISKVKEKLSEPGIYTLELSGTTKDGVTFSGSTEITVINVIPKK